MTTPTTVPAGDDRDAAAVGLRDEPLRLGERRPFVAGLHRRAHDALHRRVRKLVADGLVEILARDDALEIARGRRRGCRSGGAAGTRPSRGPPCPRARRSAGGRDMISPAVRARRTALGSASTTSERASSSVPLEHGRRRLRMPAAAERSGEHAASSSATRVRETQNTRSPISTSATRPRASVRSTSLWTRFEIPSTYSGQATAVTSTSKPPASCVSTPATSASKSARSYAPRGVCRYWAIMSWRAPWRRHQAERVGVALGDRRIGERARVLVDPEREDGRLERRRLDLALGEDPDERGRERAVVGEDEVLLGQPRRAARAVVVEDDELDPGPQRDLLELAQALGVHGLDDDQALDRVVVDRPRVRDRELVRMEAEELAHVAVQRAGQRRDRAGIEPPRGDERREGVEVGVRVRGDDVHGHEARSARR